MGKSLYPIAITASEKLSCFMQNAVDAVFTCNRNLCWTRSSGHVFRNGVCCKQ
jgi:hypothetical protein